MPTGKSLHNPVSPSPPWSPGSVSYVCRHVHPCMPTYTLTCMHLVPSSGLQNRTRVLFALWRAEGTQPHPCLRKARSWWFMGKGHSVQSSEQGTNFNQELQNDLGTEGKAPKETPPDGTLALLEDIRMRLGSSLALLPPLPPGQCCQLMGSSPSSPHQSLVICLQALWGWLPSAPVRLCCRRDLVAQGPSW